MYLDLCKRFQLACGYKREMESLAEKIVTSTIPTIEENKRMKHLIIELFVRLGHDQDDARFNTHLELGEVDSLRSLIDEPAVAERIRNVHKEGNTFLPPRKQKE